MNSIHEIALATLPTQSPGSAARPPAFDLKQFAAAQGHVAQKSTAFDAKPLDPKTVEAVKDFEAFFLGHMFKEMRASLPEGGLFPESSESRMMQDMMDENMAEHLAHKGPGVGLAQVLMKQLQQSRS